MYTNTQQAAGLDQVFTTSRQCVSTTADKAGSDFIAPALPETNLLVTMATIIVENEFVKVNTAMPDHPASCGAMKSLLQSAALNSDCLSLGAGHEAEMLAYAYTGVATQTAAAVALQNAEAKTSALRQLSELSDEGLGKLKPTARLSPKRKRALVMVSDSSTALCKMKPEGSFHQVRLGSRSEMGSSYFRMVGSALYHVLGQDIGMASMADRRTRQRDQSQLPRSRHRHHRLVVRQRDLGAVGVYPNPVGSRARVS